MPPGLSVNDGNPLPHLTSRHHEQSNRKTTADASLIKPSGVATLGPAGSKLAGLRQHHIINVPPGQGCKLLLPPPCCY
jgi:hypothetical protein